MVQLEFNITIDDVGKMSIASNVLRREDARDIESKAAHGIEAMVIAMTEAIAKGEGLPFKSEEIKCHDLSARVSESVLTTASTGGGSDGYTIHLEGQFSQPVSVPSVFGVNLRDKQTFKSETIAGDGSELVGVLGEMR